jgi:hypothetical protein
MANQKLGRWKNSDLASVNWIPLIMAMTYQVIVLQVETSLYLIFLSPCVGDVSDKYKYDLIWFILCSFS